jgi:hypothetical protein
MDASSNICHCEERSDEAISIVHGAHNSMEIASSLPSSQQQQ